jgi:hypothetical protein
MVNMAEYRNHITSSDEGLPRRVLKKFLKWFMRHMEKHT